MELAGPFEWLWLAGAFLFGLVFGSFGNVVIWRLPRGENLSHPGSHCPGCDAPIAWYDNVPIVSWVLLGGRCRSCGMPISARYPVVELLSGTLWLAAAWRFGISWSAAAAIVFFYVLLLLAFIDWDLMKLPNSLVLILLGVGVVGVAASQLLGIPAVPLISMGSGVWAIPVVSATAGAFSASALTLAISLIYAVVRGGKGYGMGDVKLIAVIGVFLGLYSLMTMFFATVGGAVFGLVAVRSAEEGGRLKIPFGPFIAAAAIIVTLCGPSLWAWYAGFSRMSL